MTDSQGHQVTWESTCKGSLEFRPSFVSLDLVAAVGCNRLDVITTGGTPVFSAEVPGDNAYVTASSAEGGRFAVVQKFLRPGDPPPICAERVTVFDINQQKAVFATDVLDWEGKMGGASGVAFSPSGASLAIKSGSTVRMFALPPTS